MVCKFCNMSIRLRSVNDALRRIKDYARREVDFAVGDLVVLLEERKSGKVKRVTKHYVDVHLDGERNPNKTVRKRRSTSLLTRLY